MSEDTRSMKDILLSIETSLRRFIEMEESWWHETERRRIEDRQRTAERDATFIERDEAWRQELRERDAKDREIQQEALQTRMTFEQKLLETRMAHDLALIEHTIRHEAQLQQHALNERANELLGEEAPHAD